MTYTPDGQAVVAKGVTLAAAWHDSCTAVEEPVSDETDEGPIFEHGLRRIEYWAKWGVADDYPSPGDQNWRNWAWEFLRRNEQYALLAAWMNGLPEEIRLREEPEADDLLEHVLCDPAPLAGQRTVENYTEYFLANDIRTVIVMPIRVLRYCWGVNWPLMPDEEFLDLTPEKQVSFFSANTAEIFAPAYLVQDEWFPEFPFQKVLGILSSKEILFKFDLSEPISGQLEIALVQLQKFRKTYFKKSRLEAMAPGDLDFMEPDDDLELISDSKNYPKALQLQLRIFDAVNMNGGFLSNSLFHKMIKVFTEELDAKRQEDDRAILLKTITIQKIKNWHNEASKIVNGNYRALARYKPLTEARKKSMRDGKK